MRVTGNLDQASIDAVRGLKTASHTEAGGIYVGSPCCYDGIHRDLERQLADEEVEAHVVRKFTCLKCVDELRADDRKRNDRFEVHMTYRYYTHNKTLLVAA